MVSIKKVITSKLIILLLPFLFLMLVPAKTAFATTPYLYSTNPANNATIGASSSLYVEAILADPSGHYMDLYYRVMTVTDPNGVTTSPGANGYYAGDYYSTNYHMLVLYNNINATIPGKYTVTVKGRDTYGYIATASWSFYVNAPPTVDQQNPAPESTIGQSPSVISARVSDANGINASSIRLNVDWQQKTHSYDPATGIVSWTPPSPYASDYNTWHYAQIWVKDNLGIETNSWWRFRVFNDDAVAPRITNISPNYDVIGNPVSVSANVEDFNGINASSRVLTLNGNLISSTYTSTGSSTGKVTASLSNMATGTYTLVLSIADNKGNVATKTWSFNYHTCTPEIQSVSPTGLLNLSSSVNISAHFYDWSGHQILPGYKEIIVKDPNNVTKTYNGSTSPAVWASNPAWSGYYDSGTNYHELDTGMTLPTPLQGNYTVTVKAKDVSGNIGSYTWTFFAGTPPTISQQTPAHGTTLGSSPAVISAKLQDADGINASTIQLTVNGSIKPHTYDPATGIVSWVPSPALGFATYNISVTAKDIYGMTSTSNWTIYVKDLEPPVLMSKSPVSDAFVNGSTPVSFTVSDPSGFNFDEKWVDGYVGGYWEYKNFWFSINGNEWVPYSKSFNGNNMTVTATNLSSYLVDGTNTISVTVTDNSPQKNQKTYTWTFRVDKSAPVISNLTPANGSTIIYPAGTVNLSAFVSDNASLNWGSRVLTLDGNPISTTYQAGGSVGAVSASTLNTSFVSGKFGQGISVTEGTSNILTQHSSFEYSGWNIPANMTRSSLQKVYGSLSLRFYSTTVAPAQAATTSYFGVAPNKTYTLSAYFLNKNFTGNFYVDYLEYDSGFNLITDGGGPSMIPGNTQWHRTSYTFTTKPSTSYVIIRVVADGAPVGEAFVDQIQLEQKPYVTDWAYYSRYNGSLTVPTSGVLSPQEGTIELWGYIDPSIALHSASNSNWTTLFSVVGNSGSNQISVQRKPSSTSWSAYVSNSSGTVAEIPLGTITSSGWNHFAVTWKQGVGASAYLNGVLKGTADSSYLPSSFANNLDLGIWRRGFADEGRVFNSTVDDLRISNRARTEVEIASTYNGSASTVDTATTYKLNMDNTLQAATYEAVNAGTITASLANPSVGTHTLVLSVADNFGNTQSSTWNFVVYDPPPTISNPSPSGILLSSRSNVTFAATAVDSHSGINGTTVKFKLDSGAYQTGTYNAASNTISYAMPDSALTFGNHTAEFRVKDNNGSEAVYSWSFSFRYIDGTTCSPANGATTEDATPTISINAARNLDTGPKNYKAKVKIDSTTYDASYNPTTGVITFTPSTNLSNGSHSITAYVLKEVWVTQEWYDGTYEVWDHDDTIDSAAWTFTVSDTTPPTITNQTPAPESVVGGKPTISAVTNDANGINGASIVLKLNGVTKAHTFNESTGLISYSVPSTLATGTHTVSLSVADKQGVVKNVSWTFDADITTPSISALTPPDGTYFADPTGTIQFSAKVADDYGINANSRILKLDNDVLVSDYNATDSKNGTVQGAFNNVPPGWHTLTVTISDNVGLTASASWKIRVTETTGPTVTEKSPIGDQYYKNTKQQVKARVQDPNELNPSSIVLKVNGVVVTHVYEADNLRSGLVTYDNPSSYPEGKNTVELTVKDDLGNQTVETWTFTIGADSNLEDIHGSYATDEDACMACHKTHQAKTGKLINRDKEQQTCYYCHNGAQTATDLQEEFGESVDGTSTKLSHHKVAEGITKCSDCHNPHGKPTQTAFLLSAGESKISTGNEFCGVCHQSIKTSVAGTPHGSATAMSPLDTTNITCLKCHEEHSSDYVALLRSPVTNQKNIKRSFAGNNSSMCETCHNDKKGQYEGEYVFNQTKHGTLASSMGQTVITHTSKTDFQAGSLDNLTATATGELQLTDAQQPGKFISPELNISGTANVSGIAKWDASGNIKVRANVSIDGIWLGWNEVANNNYIPGLKAGANFNDARLKYEVTLTNGSVTPQLRSVTIIIYKENPLYIALSALKSYPGTDETGCSNCHDPHGTPNADSLRATGNTLCSKCHDAASAIYPANYSYRGKTTYTASGHGSTNTPCLTCHNAHGKDSGSGTPLLKQVKAAGDKNCLNCHNTGTGAANVKAKFAGGGTFSHEVVTAQQAAEGATIGCTNCHNPHMNNASNKIIDIGNPSNLYNLPNENPGWWYNCSYPPANSVSDFLSRFVNSGNEMYVLVKTKHEYTPFTLSITQIISNSNSINITCTTSQTPKNKVTSAVIEWGATTSYGNSTPCTTSWSGWGGITSIQGTLSGLTPGNTYHFRVKATDIQGNVVTSEDRTVSLFSPTLVDEPDTNSGGPTTITLEWSGAPDSLYYAELDDSWLFNNAFGHRQILNWTSNTSWTVTLPISEYRTFYWRVKSKVNGTEYDWGTVSPSATWKYDQFWHGIAPPPSDGYWYCPLVFADKGDGFSYISDLSGPTINPGIPALKGDINKTLPYTLPLDLDTTQKLFNVKIRSLKQKEIDILDNVMLTVVDHAPGYEIISSSGEDKALRGESKEILYAISKDALLPNKVTNKNGVDVTTYLKYSENEPVPVEYKEGFESYILDFGKLQKPDNAKLVLDGWTVFKQDNPSITQIPRVEVMNTKGQWEIVREIGHISGDKKSMVIDMAGAFKTNDHRVRIFVGTPNAKVVLDRVRMDQSDPIPLKAALVEATAADLHFRGKATETRKSLKNPAVIKDNAIQSPIDYTFYGKFTKYGDVKELLKNRDDKFVVMQYGDEVSLEFKNPPLQQGLTRSVLLYTDFYEKQSGAVSEGKLPVEPLPFHGMSDYPYQSPEKYPDDPDHQKYLEEWQTREYLLEGGNVVLSKESLWDRLVNFIKGLFGTAKAKAPEENTIQTNMPSKLIVPEKHYSLNTDCASLWLDTIDNIVNCTISPTGADGSDAWEGTTTPAADAAGKPNPATPGWKQATAAQKTAVSADEGYPGVYWITSLATADGDYDMQMMKFKMPSSVNRNRVQSLNFTWNGYGEQVNGYNVEIYLWDFTKTGSDKWVQIENKTIGNETTVNCKFTKDYRDYCLKCHGNTPPAGLNMGSVVNIGAFPNQLHAKYNCTKCHDIHGSSNDYHIREQIDGKSTLFKGEWYSDPYYGGGGYGEVSRDSYINFCRTCHTTQASGEEAVDAFHSYCRKCHNRYYSDHYKTPGLFGSCQQCHGHGSDQFNHKTISSSWWACANGPGWRGGTPPHCRASNPNRVYETF